MEYLEEAGSLGCLEAYRVLAETSYVDGDQEKRLYYLRKGAEAGSEECRKDLISYYTMQAMPVMRSVSRLSGQAHRNKEDKELWNIYIAQLKKAEELYKKAAEAGDADSWAVLARMYLYKGPEVGAGKQEFLEAAEKGKIPRELIPENSAGVFMQERNLPTGNFCMRKIPKKHSAVPRSLHPSGTEAFIRY